MKFLVISSVAIAVAGGTWTWVAPSAKRPSTQTHVNQDADERLGLRRMLGQREDLSFVNLVVGSAHDGLRTFRARLVEDAHPRPVFGQARRICNSAPDLAECWEIASLQVDGEVRDLGQQTAKAAPTAGGPVAATAVGDEIETSDIPKSPVDPAPTVAPISAVSAPIEVEPEPAVTHLVARPIINARSGPGLTNEVLLKLTQGNRLALISKQQGWGQFIVLDGDDQGSKVWASLSILEDLR